MIKVGIEKKVARVEKKVAARNLTPVFLQYNVLVVEDDASFQEPLVLALREAGFNVCTAVTYQSALKHIGRIACKKLHDVVSLDSSFYREEIILVTPKGKKTPEEVIQLRRDYLGPVLADRILEQSPQTKIIAVVSKPALFPQYCIHAHFWKEYGLFDKDNKGRWHFRKSARGIFVAKMLQLAQEARDGVQRKSYLLI